VYTFILLVHSQFYIYIQIAEGEEATEGDVYVPEEEGEGNQMQFEGEEGNESEEEEVPVVIVNKKQKKGQKKGEWGDL
jgi:hypothetical protein